MSALQEVGGLPLDDYMACVMSREVHDGDWVSHGASVPLAGAALFLATETRAPDVDIWIQGCISPENRDLADALIAPERIYDTTRAHMSQYEIVNFSLRGQSMFQFLRPLQIDPHGNVNVSLIRREGMPPLRFHGIAVGDAINCVRRTCLYVTEHSSRVFVQELDFRTGTGHHDGSDWRPRAGLYEAGPQRVITPMAVLDFDDGGRLQIRSIHQGVTLNQVQAATGFALGVSQDLHETPAPTETELDALELVDPNRIRRLEFRETRQDVIRQLAARAQDAANQSVAWGR